MVVAGLGALLYRRGDAPAPPPQRVAASAPAPIAPAQPVVAPVEKPQPVEQKERPRPALAKAPPPKPQPAPIVQPAPKVEPTPKIALAPKPTAPACWFTDKGAWSAGGYRKLTGQHGPSQVTPYASWTLARIENAQGRELSAADLDQPGVWYYDLRTPRTARTVLGIHDHCNLGPSAEPV